MFERMRCDWISEELGLISCCEMRVELGGCTRSYLAIGRGVRLRTWLTEMNHSRKRLLVRWGVSLAPFVKGTSK